MAGFREAGKRITYFFDSLLCAFLLGDRKIFCLDKVAGLTSNAVLAALYLFAKDCPPDGDILEIGSFRGRSAFAIIFGNQYSEKKSKVRLVEAYPRPDRDSFLRNFSGLGADISLLVQSSEEARKVINAKLRLIFIDGSHDYEAVKKDILLYVGLLQEGGIIALHDFRQAGPARAIKELFAGNAGFCVCGTVGALLFASKGRFRDAGLLKRLARLEKARSMIIRLVNICGLAYLLRGKRLENY